MEERDHCMIMTCLQPMYAEVGGTTKPIVPGEMLVDWPDGTREIMRPIKFEEFSEKYVLMNKTDFWELWQRKLV